MSDDAVLLISQLDPDTIRCRLEALERERKALLVLLRAAIAAHGFHRDVTSENPPNTQ